MARDKNRRRGRGQSAGWLWATVVAGMLGFVIAGCTPRIIYVAPDGMDEASGRQRDVRGVEGPVRSVQRAMDLVREYRRGWRRLVTVVVTFNAGVYLLEQPMNLSRGDRSWLWAQTIFRASAGAQVRLVGGQALSVGKGRSDSLQHIPLGNLRTDISRLPPNERIEVYQAGARLSPVRWPYNGWLTITDMQTAGEFVKLTFQPALPSLTTDRKAFAHGYWYWDWADQVVDARLDSVAPDIMWVPANAHRYGYRKGQRFYLFGFNTALARSGEYKVDRAAGELQVRPWVERGSELVVATIPTLVALSDTKNIRFVDLRFEASTADAIRVINCDNVVFDHCRVQNTGGWGIYISGGRRNGVQRSEITDTGAGGVALFGGDRVTLSPAGHFATENHITFFGRWARTYSPAVALQGVGQVVRANRISDAPHVAILFAGNDHQIEANEISRVCLETQDCGAIYGGRSWTMRGNRIVENQFVDIGAGRGLSVSGVYLDDLLSGVEVRGNRFTRVGCGILLGGGRDCAVQENTFVDCDVGVYVDGRGLEPAWVKTVDQVRATLDELPYRSVLWRKHYPALADLEREGPAGPFGTIVAGNRFKYQGEKRQMQIASAAQACVVRRDNRRSSALRTRRRHCVGWRQLALRRWEAPPAKRGPILPRS